MSSLKKFPTPRSYPSLYLSNTLSRYFVVHSPTQYVHAVIGIDQVELQFADFCSSEGLLEARARSVRSTRNARAMRMNLAMPMLTLNLALRLVFDFALLNLSARDRYNSRRQSFEFLEWRFFALVLLLWHSKESSASTVEMQAATNKISHHHPSLAPLLTNPHQYRRNEPIPSDRSRSNCPT